MRRLIITCNGQRAGLLTETDQREYIFAYDSDYLHSGNPSISITLPKRAEAYRLPYLFPFFTNLLPEGANKRYLCRRMHIDERDSMGLLTAFASKDFIGNIGVELVQKTYDETNYELPLAADSGI